MREKEDCFGKSIVLDAPDNTASILAKCSEKSKLNICFCKSPYDFKDRGGVA